MSRPETTLPAELVRIIINNSKKLKIYSIIIKKKQKNTLQSKIKL